MKQLNVPNCNDANNLERHTIDFVPWPSYSYKPKVSFSIAYNDENIFLKYFVRENAIRANACNTNGNVWEDSCVEFFISFDETGYYNLEFNCIGTALIGFGKSKNDRQLIDTEVINRISTQSVIQKTGSGMYHWELSLVIPLEVFEHHHLPALKGRQCRANFYKCGDLLPEPHFLAWSGIDSAEPNFHLPQFFGTLNFT